MDLRDALHVLRRGWAVVLGLMIAGTALGIVATLATKKVYRSDVQIFVATSTSSNATDLAQGATFAQDRVQSYTSIAKSPDVTGPVIDKLGLNLTRGELAAKISADAPLNKVLINLHVTDHDPAAAQRIAAAVATRFDTVVQDTEQTDADGKRVVKLSVVIPANRPTTPIEPDPVRNIGLGLVIGLLVGIAVVVVRARLDNTVKGPADFEPLGIPVLGYVPFDKSTSTATIAFRDDPHGTRSEAYRQLRTSLQFVRPDHAPSIIAVTSAVPGEGKTTTAVNLAAALAEGGYRVCLIEADLRRPNIARLLGLVGEVGLTTTLIGQAPVESVLQNAGRNLAVMTSGPVPPNPSELLLSGQARAVIMEVATMVDYVIIDTAPLLPVVDAADVAVLADATMVVHHAGKSTREQARRSVDALAKAGEKPVGVVLNMVTRRRGRYDDIYNYYYRPDTTLPDTTRPESDLAQPAASNGAVPARRRPRPTAAPRASVNGHDPAASSDGASGDTNVRKGSGRPKAARATPRTNGSRKPADADPAAAAADTQAGDSQDTNSGAGDAPAVGAPRRSPRHGAVVADSRSPRAASRRR